MEDDMSVEEHIAALKSKHAELEHLLDDENHRPHPDQILISDIKKQKLRIKDELAQINGN
jgi:hypothetical protein